MNFKIQMTKPQKKFALCQDPYPAMVGGLGSGKSEAGILRILLLMFENYKNTQKAIDCLITFPTYDLCKLRGMSGTREILERSEIPFTENKSEYSVTIPPFGRILFRSYDRPERIIAFQSAYSLCDELDTLPKDKADFVWRKISERTRQKAYRENSIAVATTPDQGVNGFVYSKWVKSVQTGYTVIKAPTDSNPFLPKGYINQIRNNYDPVMADAYLRGEFISFNRDKVYHTFNRLKHHTNRTMKQEERLHIGIDFNIGGTVAIVFVIEKNNPVAVDEFTSHDTRDFTNNLAKRYKDHRLTVYPDASGRANRTNASMSDVEIIQQAGYTVDAPRANPAIRDRVNAVNGLLAHDKLKVNTDKCPELTEALESQGYDKNGEPEKFNVHPAIDDYVDSASYFINRKYPINKPIIFTGISSAM